LINLVTVLCQLVMHPHDISTRIIETGPWSMSVEQRHARTRCPPDSKSYPIGRIVEQRVISLPQVSFCVSLVPRLVPHVVSL
jgi:hypothetical protein